MKQFYIYLHTNRQDFPTGFYYLFVAGVTEIVGWNLILSFARRTWSNERCNQSEQQEYPKADYRDR